jgi:DNA-directed RNA polymerase subunit K/omega
MSEIKQKAQGINPFIVPRNADEIANMAYGNIYESLNIIAKRSKQIAVDLKRELHAKLDEFASSTDTLEEVHENKEQIEISKFYERLPNPVIIALQEFYDGKIGFRYRDESENSEEIVEE